MCHHKPERVSEEFYVDGPICSCFPGVVRFVVICWAVIVVEIVGRNGGKVIKK